MTEVLVKALISFTRSPNGDDELSYDAGEVYPFPASKLAAYVKAGRVERVEPDKKPKKAPKKRETPKTEEPKDGTSEEKL